MEFSMMVQVQDGGSPPLATNLSVNVFVTDLNDNAPTVLYPLPNSTSSYTDAVAPGTPVGHVVTKLGCTVERSSQPVSSVRMRPPSTPWSSC
ncbi:UNVERIFIED_CONTAM: hypothetical protein H355_012094 [Colinus virginianus]|nr:hypothetical protein H355_012094 [Colinus virginianus]